MPATGVRHLRRSPPTTQHGRSRDGIWCRPIGIEGTLVSYFEVRVRVCGARVFQQDLHGEGEGGQEQARKLRDFFTALALCHTVIPERFEDTDEVCPS